MISDCFQSKPFNIMVIQVYAPNNNVEEAEVKWFYEDLQDLFEHLKKEVFFFSFFKNFYFYFIFPYNTVLVLPYIDMNPPRVYM